jgi:hypothetical protein
MKYVLFGILVVIFFAIILPKIFNFFNAWVAFGEDIAGVIGIYYYISPKIKKFFNELDN